MSETAPADGSDMDFCVIEVFEYNRRAMQCLHTLHEPGLCIREEGRPGEAVALSKQCLATKEAVLARGHVHVTASARVGCVCSTGRNELKAGGVVDGTAVGQFRAVACADGLYTAAECMHSRQAGCVQEAKEFLACCLGIFEELGLDSSSSFFFFFFLIYPRICQYWTRVRKFWL